MHIGKEPWCTVTVNNLKAQLYIPDMLDSKGEFPAECLINSKFIFRNRGI